MKATGIIRKIDDLGRFVIPVEIRKTLLIDVGDALEIFTDDAGHIILAKYQHDATIKDALAVLKKQIEGDDSLTCKNELISCLEEMSALLKDSAETPKKISVANNCN